MIYSQVTLNYIIKDTNKIYIKNNVQFKTIDLAKQRLSTNLSEWQSKGYITSSVDSLVIAKDTINAYTHIGKKYYWKSLIVNDTINQIIQSLIPNYDDQNVNNVLNQYNIPQILLNHFKNNGYPFAVIQYKNIQVLQNNIEINLLHIVF